MQCIHKDINLVSITDIGGYKHYINLEYIINISESINDYYIIYMFNGNQIKVGEHEVEKLI